MLIFVAEATVRSSALIVAVWVLLQVSRTRDPITEKLAWTLVLVASLTMPFLTWSAVADTIPLEIVPVQVTASMNRLVELPPATHAFNAVVLTAYFLGVGAFAARFVSGLLTGSRLRRGAQRAPTWKNNVDVRLSADVKGPVSFGSTVILPASSVTWDARTARAVLAHESEHIRNRDCYRLWLALLCRAAFWFNPLVHWLYRRLALLTELTSDAAAAMAIGDRSSYVAILVQVATETSTAQAVVPMAARSTLTARLRRLLACDELSVEVSPLRKVLLGVGVVLLGAVMSAQASKPRPLVLTPLVLKARMITVESAKTSNRSPPVLGPASTQPPVLLAPLVKAKVIYAPNPFDFYPEALRDNNEQGDGRAHICIDKRGHVSANVARSTGDPKLDAQMLKLAEAFRFLPATRGGNPVRSCLMLPVKFVLMSG